MLVDDMTVYLDYNATAPLRPEVAQAVMETLALPLNASSQHQFGRRAKKIVEDGRRKLAERINCWPQEIIWTASATEANNAALSQFNSVWVSAIEHSSVLKAVYAAEIIPVTADGIVDLDWLQEKLSGSEKPELISVMFANNETGVIQPIRKVVKLAHKHGVMVHCDAVQAVGKVPLDFSSLGVDYMTLGFHKCGAPQGVGALVVANGKPFTPFIKGGGQEFNRRAGTENVAALAGLNAWLDLPEDYSHMERLRGWLDEMEKALTPPTLRGEAGREAAVERSSQIAPSLTLSLKGEGIRIVGKNAPRLPNTSCLILPSHSQEITLIQADLAGIAISAGSACSSGRIEPSHVLTAMGYSKEEAGRAIRISGGWGTTREDIARVSNFLRTLVSTATGH